MRRIPLLVAGMVAGVLPLTAVAQSGSRVEIRTRGDGTVICSRDGRTIDCATVRKDSERARTLAERRAADARARAEAARRRTDEARDRLRERIRDIPRRRVRDDTRPRIGIGGGADVRRFDSVDRYSGQLGVDFRGRSGIGIRPEVVYAWTDRQRASAPSVSCETCLALFAPYEYRSRSKLLGANLNATYAFLRGSPIRPYALGGIGVLVTQEVAPVLTSSAPLSGLPGTAFTYRTEGRNRTDIGLNAGAGLEFGRGPVRLFTEMRYYLLDRASTRGFSGMLPITAGLRF